MTTPVPDDDTLTETGLEARGRGRVLLIACGALAREILALTRLNGWSHVDLACLPAKLHNTPGLIPGVVRFDGIRIEHFGRHRNDFTFHFEHARAQVELDGVLVREE